MQDWLVNPASSRVFSEWVPDERIFRRYGITEFVQDEVSRITNNKTRIDNASVGKQTSFGGASEDILMRILGIDRPWSISKFTMALYENVEDYRDLRVRGEILVELDVERRQYDCPLCGQSCKVHQYESRFLSHPRLMGMATVIHAKVPKLRCIGCDAYPQISIPWARPKVSYTKLMERETFLLLQDMPVHNAAIHSGLTDRIVWEMIRFRVEQGLESMDLSKVTLIYVDETSSKKGHNYITVVCDQDGRIIYVREGKDSTTMDDLAIWLVEHNGHPENILYVSCDLGDAYPAGVRRNFPNAVIIYDHFHAVKLINEALDAVLKRAEEENAQLRFLRSKLRMNQSKMDDTEARKLERTVQEYRELSEDYRLKNVFTSIYNYAEKETARHVLHLWYEDVKNLGSPEMRVKAKSIREREEGILAWFDMRISNGYAEGINSLIQTTKRVSRGFRDVRNFIAMIYLRNGHLRITFD